MSWHLLCFWFNCQFRCCSISYFLKTSIYFLLKLGSCIFPNSSFILFHFLSHDNCSKLLLVLFCLSHRPIQFTITLLKHNWMSEKAPSSPKYIGYKVIESSVMLGSSHSDPADILLKVNTQNAFIWWPRCLLSA